MGNPMGLGKLKQDLKKGNSIVIPLKQGSDPGKEPVIPVSNEGAEMIEESAPIQINIIKSGSPVT